MADVFISYSHLDAISADYLVDGLIKNGISCFIDKDGIIGGDDWASVIVGAIDVCRTVIVLCSENSDASSQVLSEIVLARNRKKTIIPVKIGRYTRSAAMDYHLSAYQTVDAEKGVTPQTVAEILLKMKKGTEYSASAERPDFYPPKDADIKGPAIFDTASLLEKNYSYTYVSMKHIELDYLTVNREKYDIDDEVEGTMDTWIGMIGETADCSAQLVANNEIVGYLDFIPVSPEDYDLLTTNQKYFSDEVVAYYSFGGDFDVYVSMFSVNYNFATPQNYLLFFAWMVEKLEKWKEEDINIHRITFSIYMDSQVKALKALGFRPIFENRIKGMLLESTYEELMEHPVVKNKLKKRKTE
ncbi:MAG: toll/interleukin-1 receptor domain-containing protein [Clostridia bacterium]|nr:toll/interleukin-1 receptor domain-containing protein [Clostridia bacterium]